MHYNNNFTLGPFGHFRTPPAPVSLPLLSIILLLSLI